MKERAAHVAGGTLVVWCDGWVGGQGWRPARDNDDDGGRGAEAAQSCCDSTVRAALGFWKAHRGLTG